MIPLDLDAVADLCPGSLTRAPDAESITGVQIDSRRIRPGDLFVAVGAGAAFAAEALALGAAAALVPDEPPAALAALGGAVRDRSAARVVGITGSMGKTSTKDILAAVCRSSARVVAAEHSFNNELGVPLTLCRLEPDTEICILELGTRGLGQIAALAAFARPELGVVTTIGPVHLEVLGSLAGVARAKGELIDALPRGGIAVVPSGVPELEPYLGRGDVEVRRFGPGGEYTLESADASDRGATLVLALAGRRVTVELSLTVRHQAENALAAVVAADALGLPLPRRIEVELSRWRGEEVELAGGGLLINDSYNANPISMRAALATLAARADGRRTVAVLGDMTELGPGAPAYHREIGAAADVDLLVAVGSLAAHYVEGASPSRRATWVPALDEALALLPSLVEPGDVVLVKGSRAMGLDAVAEALVA